MTTHREHINYRMLDAKIAEEVMGWKILEEHDADYFGKHEFDNLINRVPHYTTDIGDAFTIIEHIRGKYAVNIHTLAISWYQCVLDVRDEAARYPIEVPHDGDTFANSETVQMAICLATYNAVTGKDLILGW